MKRFYFFFSILLVSLFIYTIISWTPGNSKDGIQFFEGSWQEALIKAKAENKPIFMDIYATWCGPCKMLKKKTFSDKDAGTYFNANFINLSFNGEAGEGEMLANKFKITGYPSLIVLNSNGKLIHLQTGYLSANELIAFGKQALGKQQ